MRVFVAKRLLARRNPARRDSPLPRGLQQLLVRFYSVYVPLRPICEYLGLSWAGQRERVMRDEVLAQAVRSVRLSPPAGGGGGTQELLCLPLDYLPGWLFGTSVNRVRPHLRPLLHRYRRECFRVLAAAFPPHLVLPHRTVDDDPVNGTYPGSVYMVAGAGCCKIGSSRAVKKRLDALERALPFALTVVFIIDTDDMLQLERRLHELYRRSGKHVKGEWFRLVPADIVALKALATPLCSEQFDLALRSLEVVQGVRHDTQ